MKCSECVHSTDGQCNSKDEVDFCHQFEKAVI